MLDFSEFPYKYLEEKEKLNNFKYEKTVKLLMKLNLFTLKKSFMKKLLSFKIKNLK